MTGYIILAKTFKDFGAMTDAMQKNDEWTKQFIRRNLVFL